MGFFFFLTYEMSIYAYTWDKFSLMTSLIPFLAQLGNCLAFSEKVPLSSGCGKVRMVTVGYINTCDLTFFLYLIGGFLVVVMTISN